MEWERFNFIDVQIGTHGSAFSSSGGNDGDGRRKSEPKRSKSYIDSGQGGRGRIQTEEGDHWIVHGDGVSTHGNGGRG